MLKYDTRLSAAIDLASRGLKVFPLRPGSKIPAIRGWQALATTDEAKIREWWRTMPTANIGYLTNDLVLIDVDPRHGGEATWAALDVEHDPDTLQVRSPQDGTHIVYRCPPGVRVQGGAHKLGRGVDIKAVGGLAVGPGSVWDENGRGYYILKDRPIREAPPSLIARVSIAPAKTEAPVRRLVEQDALAIELATGWMLHEAPDAFDGNRNNTAYGIAVKLFDFGVSFDTALDLLLEWNSLRCFPPLPVEGADSISVATTSGMHNRQNPIGILHPKVQFAGCEDLNDPPPAPPLQRSRFEIKWFDDLTLNTNRRDLVKGILPKEGLAVIWGKWKSIKTFWLADILMHVAIGREYRKRRVQQGAVIYVVLESPGGFYTRLIGWRKYFLKGYAGPSVPFGIISSPLDLVKDWAELAKIIKSNLGPNKLACVAIDTLSRSLRGSEGKDEDMSAYVSACDRLQKALGGLIALVHHHGHDGSRMRGFSGLPAAEDVELRSERNGDLHTVTVMLRRDGGGEEEQVVSRVKEITVGHDDDGEPITTLVLLEASLEEADLSRLTAAGQMFARALASELFDRCGKEDLVGQVFDSEFARGAYARAYKAGPAVMKPKEKRSTVTTDEGKIGPLDQGDQRVGKQKYLQATSKILLEQLVPFGWIDKHKEKQWVWLKKGFSPLPSKGTKGTEF